MQNRIIAAKNKKTTKLGSIPVISTTTENCAMMARFINTKKGAREMSNNNQEVYPEAGVNKIAGKPPCYKCNDRTIYCHSECEKYKSWRTKLTQANETLRKSQEAQRRLDEYEVNMLKTRYSRRNDKRKSN